MMRLRHIVQSALCCLLCLTVCVSPVLAGNGEYTEGFIYPSNDAYVRAIANNETVDFLRGYFPASFDSSSATVSEYERKFKINGSWFQFSTYVKPTFEIPNMYIEILFPVTEAVTVTLSAPAGYEEEIGGCVIDGSLYAMREQIDRVATSIASPCQIFTVYDDATHECSFFQNTFWVAPVGTYDINQRFGIKYVFSAKSVTSVDQSDYWALVFSSSVMGAYDFVASEPIPDNDIFNQVVINTGLLQNIDGKLTEIQTSTTQIQNDVSEIKDGLQDSNSSIWGAFKESISGLFVPSSDDLAGVKDGFDQLAGEKLGGVYQSFGVVSDGVSSVVNKLKNPGSNPGVEFPGISVPLGGDVGTVTLAASQTVTIPEEITNVLYPVSGVIIPVISVIWTLRQCYDMLTCFMSGMSYGEFLHRHTDEEDDSV